MKNSLRISISKRNALAFLGEISTSKPFQLTKEPVDNSLDSGAKHIWVYLDLSLNEFSVIDDGHGIFAEIPEHDYEILALTNEDPNDFAMFNNLNSWQSPFSLWSYQYMILHTASSVKSLDRVYPWLVEQYVKTGGLKPASIGIKGIGFLSCLFGCEQVTVTSKPALGIAKNHFELMGYDTAKMTEAMIPVSQLIYPKREDLRDGKDISPTIQTLKSGLINSATGQEMTQGTIVTMKGINAWITMDRLIPMINQTFGLVLQRTSTELWIYERKFINQRIGDGKTKAMAQISHKQVKGFRKPANLLYEKIIPVGDYSAQVSIWPADKDSFPISFFHSGVRASEVSQLDLMDRLWSDKGLTGIVELTGPGTSVWNTNKELPNTQNSTVFKLLQKINDEARNIGLLYEQQSSKVKNKEIEVILTEAGNLLSEVMASEDYDFLGQSVKLPDVAIYKGSKNRSKVAKQKPLSKQKNMESQIFVIDEWGMPLPNDIGVLFTIKSINRDQQILSQSPRNSSVNLGELETGVYRVSVKVPLGMTVFPTEPQEFSVVKGRDRKVLKYKIKTGLPSRIKHQAPRLKIMPRAMGEDQMIVDGSDFKNLGVVYINIDSPVFSNAFESRDYRSLASAIAYPSVTAIFMATMTLDEFVANLMLKTAQSLEQSLSEKYKSIMKEKR